jgi:hypothetical protein
MLWVSDSLLVMGLVLSSWLPNTRAASPSPFAGRVVSGAVGACGRASGEGSQSLCREEVIDMWDTMRTNVSSAEDGNVWGRCDCQAFFGYNNCYFSLSRV